MTISLLVAFIVAPFLAYRLMKNVGHGEEEYELHRTMTYRIYNGLVRPMLARPPLRWAFLASMVLVLLASMALVGLKLVTVKMLPFDNKSEFQVIVDMPEGTPLERTAMVAREIGLVLHDVPEVTDYQMYVGENAPINFNGLVRHYYFRRGSHMADIQVNLVEKSDRKRASHDIALAVRGPVQKVAERHGARVKIAEVPPGPPVMSTLVAEVYGPDHERQIEIAESVRRVFEKQPGVVDVDWMVEDEQVKHVFDVDKERAALSGVSPAQVAQTLRVALAGMDAGLAHMPAEYEPVTVNLQLPREDRSGVRRLKDIYVQSATGRMVPVSELVTVREAVADKTIHHKNLRRVVYVTGDVAGSMESPVYAMLAMRRALKEIDLPEGYSLKEYWSGSPEREDDFGLKWDGEWQITLEVFRDLGLAFGVVLILIYVLIVAWFQSFVRPLVMMIAIPLTLVGVLPLHWATGAFFTATSMIGVIALAGIVVRNSILLIDFAEMRLAEGMSLREAVIESGAVRFRPIALTAGTVVVGAIPILLDPIFQGLAVALMGGAVASTVLTLIMVPVVYFMIESASRDPDAKLDAFGNSEPGDMHGQLQDDAGHATEPESGGNDEPADGKE
jgi:multidrug efflux pump subunit AcrB